MKPKANNKKTMLIGFGIGYVILFLMTAAACSAMESDSRLTFFNAMMGSIPRIMSMKFQAFFPASPKFGSNIAMLSFVYAIACLLWHLNDEKNKNTLPGKENGSAEWNTNLGAYDKVYTFPYGKPTHSYENNVILTQNVFLGTDGRVTKRNLNTLVIGGSGAGKSRFYVKPNLLQTGTNSSFVITDPSGELLESCGTFLEQQGYKISVLNLTDMSASYCYNPFEYIRKEEDVLVLINCLIKNTTPPGSSKGDPFWEKSETALLTAIFFYLKYHRPESEQNFTNVMKLLRAANINEDDSSSQSPLDYIMEDIGKENPNDIGYKSYMTFRMGAGKTLKSILISCAVRLNAFEIPAVAALVRHDYEHPDRNINLSTIGFEKTALFCILPQADDTYNFIVSMMYYQLFESLYYLAEHEKGGLKYSVRFMLDEFCNIGQIPEYDKKLATMRKYGLSCSIIVQNLKQLEEMYDKKTEGLIGNCDSILFLGSSEYSTLEFISKKLGDATIVTRNTSRSQGRSGSSSMSYNKSARKLLNPDEVGRIGGNNCILFIRECLPFLGPKYELTKHPNYKYTGDADAALKYDVKAKFKLQDKSSEEDDARIDNETPAATKENTSETTQAEPAEETPQTHNSFTLKGEGIRGFIANFFNKKRNPAEQEDPDNVPTDVEDLFNQANNNEEINEESVAAVNEEEMEAADVAMGEEEFTVEAVDEDALWPENSSSSIPTPLQPITEMKPSPEMSNLMAADDDFDSDDDEEDDFSATDTEVQEVVQKKSIGTPAIHSKEEKTVLESPKQKEQEAIADESSTKEEAIADLFALMTEGEEAYQAETDEAAELAIAAEEAAAEAEIAAEEAPIENIADPAEEVAESASSIAENTETATSSSGKNVINLKPKTLGSLLMPKKVAKEETVAPSDGAEAAEDAGIIENDRTESRVVDYTHSAIKRKNKTLASLSQKKKAEPEPVKEEPKAEKKPEQKPVSKATSARTIGIEEDDESEDDFAVAETSWY